MDTGRKEKKRKRDCVRSIMESWSSSNIAAAYYYKYMYKEPRMTSPQTGEAWMNEVLNGHHIRSVNAFRMHSHVFLKLCGELESSHGLKSSDRMTVVEKVGIFVYTLALGVSNRDVSECFQPSGETISRAFHEVLEAITARSKGFHGLAREMIKPKDPTFQETPPKIMNDNRYTPYFKDCIGCIDGTHIGACIPESEQMPYIGRKGLPTFNVMAACDFDLCFTFISVGWEGSAHDTRVFLSAINNPSMNFPKPPDGKYYLVDKGYPDKKGYLVPYPKTRYHNSQFENEPPNNIQESFNRSHSSLRSAIERSFGILKKRWKILGKMPKYSVKTQLDVIMAAFALHNYIRNNDKEDTVFTTFEQHPDYMGGEELRDVRGSNANNDDISSATSTEMKQIRNDIATSIWNARRR